jgi:DNA end-binding protein Ku
VDALAKDFEPGKYHDEHRARLMELIRARSEGRQVAPSAEKPEPSKVVNLMDALRQSVEQVKKPLSKAEPAAQAAAGGKGRRAVAAAEARPVRKAARK